MSLAGQRTSPHELSNRLILTLRLGAIAIGIIVLIGYALGSPSIATLGMDGKPAAAVSALVFIGLGAGVLSTRWPLLTGGVDVPPRRPELRMVELKQQINELCAQLGQSAPMFFLKRSHLPRRHRDDAVYHRTIQRVLQAGSDAAKEKARR